MKETGGPAFPDKEWNNGAETYVPINGMTLRDYFAGQTLVGLFSNPRISEKAEDTDIAKAAYQMADAMIQERSKE